MVANTNITDYEDIWSAALNRCKIPLTLTVELNKMKTIVNEQYQNVAARQNWWWLMLYQRVLQLAEDFTTGTVTPTLASKDVVGVSTVWTSTNNVGTNNLLAGDYIKFGADTEIYEVKTVTDATNIVLGNADANMVYVDSTQAGTTYKSFRYLYDLPSNFSEIISVYKATAEPNILLPKDIATLRKLIMAGDTGEVFTGTATEAGEPAYYAITGNEATKQMFVWPAATADMNLYYDYKRRITFLSADGDLPLVPLEFRPLLVAASVEAYAIYNLRNQGLAAFAKQEKDALLRRMTLDDRQKPYMVPDQFAQDGDPTESAALDREAQQNIALRKVLGLETGGTVQ